MTEKLFWQDPYHRELATRIRTVDGDELTLEETIFYAISGGQESDRGTIEGHPVLEARKQGRDILYRLESDHGLRPGQPVTVKIDWPRRYRLMRLHFAAEIVLELMYRRAKPLRKIGAHIGEDKARIDFEWTGSIAPLLPTLALEAQAIVAADHRIESAYSDEVNEQRYWKIPAFAEVPCGGTHLKRTGEIGEVSLKRKNIGKGKERIEIYVSE